MQQINAGCKSGTKQGSGSRAYSLIDDIWERSVILEMGGYLHLSSSMGICDNNSRGGRRLVFLLAQET